MQLARFLNKIFKKGGFVLSDANSKEYIIGEPNDNPMKLKILNKNLHYKLLFHPDLYFGDAYTNGEIVIENGSLTDFLDLALMNFGRGELNFFSYLINRLRGSYRYLTNFNFIKNFVPEFSLLSNHILPFIKLTINLEIDRPKPDPPYLLVIKVSACVKES